MIGDAEVLVTRAYNDVTARVIEAARDLRLVAQGTSGTDNIDAAATRARGIEIISLPGENANAVAELVIGFMISMTRTVPFYQQQMRDGIWQRDDCATRHELAHHRLGIIGLGEVGKRVARLARAFGMHVTAFDPYIDHDAFAERRADRAESLEALLAASDIVTVHVPLSDETHHLLDAARIAQLPRGAYVINAARGPVLDFAAAVAALQSGHLSGIALDVYEPEPPRFPLPDDPRIVMTPHVAGCTFEAKASIGTKLYGKVTEWLDRR